MMSIESYYVKEVFKDGQLRYLIADKLTQAPIKTHWSFDYPDVAYAQLTCLEKEHARIPIIKGWFVTVKKPMTPSAQKLRCFLENMVRWAVYCFMCLRRGCIAD